MAITRPTVLEPWSPTAEWGTTEQRRYSIGVDRGMLYLDGVGVPWTGLVSVNRKAGEGETRKRYIDGRIYSVSVPETDYAASLRAFTYPDEFDRCIGNVSPDGTALTAHGQPGRSFGLSYRTLSGDGEGHDQHYKIHLVYNCVAEESDYENGTINDSPELSPFEFNLTGIPVTSPGLRPTSYFSIDSREVSDILLRGLEHVLYGKGGTPPVLPPIADIRSYLTG